MVAVRDRWPRGGRAFVLGCPMTTTALDLARGYDRYVSALWRGESAEVRRFAAWLKECWGLDGPPEPDGPPAAISALGGAGTSIRWYEGEGVVLGYIPGVAHRCYRIPNDADVPAVSFGWDRKPEPEPEPVGPAR